MAEVEGASGTQSNTGGGSVFNRKLFGLPVWALMLVGLGAAIALSSWQKNKKAATAQQQTTTSPGVPSTSIPSSLIPQFVNQVYTGPTPPVQSGAPAPAPSDTQGVLFTSDGTTTLNQYAAKFNTQPAEIIWQTTKNERTPQELNNYINAGQFDNPIPQGQDWYYPVPASQTAK